MTYCQIEQEHSQPTVPGPHIDKDLYRRLVGVPSRELACSVQLPEEDLFNLIGEYQGQPQWLPYEVLFMTVGLDKRRAVMAIPFLESDTDYNIPGFKTQWRFNFGCAGLASAKEIQDKLPHIPLIEANMVDGIPFADNSVDWLVVNHGVIVENLSLDFGFRTRREQCRYLSSAGRVVKPGGMALFFDYDFGAPSPMKIGNIAYELGMELVDFRYSWQLFITLKERMADLDSGQSLVGLDKINRFEDLLAPWSMRKIGFEMKAYVLRKPF